MAASRKRTEVEAYRAQARKIERAIATLAAGGDDTTRQHSADARIVFDMINKLGERANKPEIRGDDTLREEAWAIETDLRKHARAADEAGFHARQSLRQGEISALKTAERERITNMSPFERETYNYQQDLKLRR